MNVRSWLIGGLFACLSLRVLHPMAAAAHGAIAVGFPPNVASQGFAIGSVRNHASYEDARREAVAVCRRSAGASEAARNLCTPVAGFRDMCFATAMDPMAGTPGVGWAVAESREEASRQALAFCRSTAGADRADQCRIEIAQCDGAAQ
jgi:hypothetical protein